MVHGSVYAGVDIGGTKTAVVLSSKPPVILRRTVFPTEPASGPTRALRLIIEGLRDALSSQGLIAQDLHSIGVSCGSPSDPLAGVIHSPPNLPTWVNVHIKAILEEEFGVPCFLENDANAGALAEYWFGAGKGCDNMVFLTLGTGLGAGLILDGRLYRGTSNLAGEIGHVRLSRSGPMGHGKAGSVEGWASGGGIAQIAEWAVREASLRGEATELAQQAAEKRLPYTAQAVWKVARSGDRVARNIVDIAATRLGEAIAILADILNPQRIVVGGLALRMGEALLGPARAVVAREALAGTFEVCQIIPASLDEEIGDVAALCVALNSEATAGRTPSAVA